MYRPVVKKTDGKRKGRGFSLRELQEAGITLVQGKKLGIAVDRRRKSLHKENVEVLKRITVQKLMPKEKVVRLEEIKGVGPKKAEQLTKAGVRTANDLLKADLKDLSEKSGISTKVLGKFAKEAEKLIK